MKSIKLEVGPAIKVKEENGDIVERPTTTEELIVTALNHTPKDGFTYKDMKERMAIEEAMKKAKQSDKDGKFFFELEDAQFDYLKNCVNSMKWGSRLPFLMNFLEQFQK